MKNLFAKSASSKSKSYSIQGKSASLYEYYVAVALDTIGIDYVFQYTFWGGKILAGGQVIDFVVMSTPPTPLEINEEYWHRDATKEALQEIQINSILMGRGFAPLVILWGEQVETQEKALESIRELFNG